MVETSGRGPRGHFPFVFVFLAAFLVGGEYIFAILGTFQIHSDMRGKSSRRYAEANQVLETRMNNTIESLVLKFKNPTMSDEQMALLEKRIASLEGTLQPLDDESEEGGGQLERLNGNIAHIIEQLVANEKRVRILDAGSLQQRLSSLEKKVQALKPRDEQSQGEDSRLAPLDESKVSICVPWEVDMDSWWTHNPDWYVSKENSSHFCFSAMEDHRKATFFRKLYEVQFKTGDCSKVMTKSMWNSGYGADFLNVVDGLLHAYRNGIPMQMIAERPWHYAGKRGSRPVCKTKDMYCYFLNMTRCEADRSRIVRRDFVTKDYQIRRGIGRWLLEYATRQQTWLRREVYEFSNRIKITTPCAAIHVRRTDIVLHGEWSRKYRPIEDYVNELDNSTQNILLLTDDQNAIEEALAKYPDYNWMYIKRPRHRGTEGGWENQIPSDNPKLELIVLLSIFRLVRQCSSFIHTHGNFADILKGEIKDAHKDYKQFNVVNLDDNNPEELFSVNNSMTVNLSTSFT